MSQRQLTINLPESVETLNKVIKFLLQYDLIPEKVARTLEPEETGNKPMKKSRWALVAEEMSEENLLGDGLGEELRQYIHEFRDGFVFKDSLDPGE